ncbi:MAG: HEAT repeat domain-containing protein [Gammaproteobacteria bacterium]
MDVTRAPWTEVLGEIARQTGIRFHYAIAPQGLVTVSCPRMTVTRALECLLGHDAALMLRYAPGRAKPRRVPLPADVWLLGQSGTGSEGSGVVQSQSTDPQQVTSHHPAPAAKDDVRALIDLSKSEDPDARMQALGSLAASGQQSDRAVQEAFRAGLMDENGSVRAQAVYALAKDGGAEAVNVLRDALQDRDASVRLMAVDSAQADEQGAALLQQALTDSDETVRVLAAMKLKETERSEGLAR